MLSASLMILPQTLFLGAVSKRHTCSLGPCIFLIPSSFHRCSSQVYFRDHDIRFGIADPLAFAIFAYCRLGRHLVETFNVATDTSSL